MARFDHLEIGPDPGELGNQAPPALRQVDELRPFARADQCRRQGQYENALRFYSRALESDKSLVAAWVGQVQMLVQLDEAPEADLWARKALEIFPNNGELLAARAQALARLGDTKQAGAACDGALSAAGKSAYRWMVRGEWILATRQQLAEHCFDKAQQIDRDWLVPMETALVYLHYQFPSRAVARARMATESAPDQFYAWYVRGRAEAEAAMDRSAADSFQHCLQLCPGHVDAQRRLSELALSGSSFVRWCRRLLFRR